MVKAASLSASASTRVAQISRQSERSKAGKKHVGLARGVDLGEGHVGGVVEALGRECRTPPMTADLGDAGFRGHRAGGGERGRQAGIDEGAGGFEFEVAAGDDAGAVGQAGVSGSSPGLAAHHQRGLRGDFTEVRHVGLEAEQEACSRSPVLRCGRWRRQADADAVGDVGGKAAITEDSSFSPNCSMGAAGRRSRS